MAYNFNIVNPLQALNDPPSSDRYSFTYLKYPLNFDGAFTQGHYMNFYINAHKDSSYFSSGSTSQNSLDGSNTLAYNWESGSGAFGIKALSQTLSNSFTPSSSVTDKTLGEGGADGIGASSISSTYKRISTAISLYIPNDNISFQTNSNWAEDSITTRGGTPMAALQYASDLKSIFKSAYDNAQKTGGNKGVVGKTVSSMMTNATLKAIGAEAGGSVFENKFGTKIDSTFLLGVNGLAINPNILVLYRSQNLRDFQFRFIFIPSNQDEALNVRNIIKMFRFHAAPEVLNSNQGSSRFFVAPSLFDIEFFHKNERNQNIPKITTCALMNIGVDYAPHGWTTFVDGMPIETVLDLRFKEVELITKDKVNSGF